jgi:hypothetical protein
MIWIALTLMFIAGAWEHSSNYLCRIAPGMCEEQVARAWGQPDQVVTSSYTNSEGSQVKLSTWVYRSPDRLVKFRDSKAVQCSEPHNGRW